MNNRDIPLLTRIFYIMQDIRSLQHRSDFQADQLTSTTKRLTGMPGGGGLPHGFDAIIGELEELNSYYGEKIEEYVKELRKAENILNGIRDQNMRTFVRMFYVDQLAQTEVIRELEMTDYQFERARRLIEEAECMRKVDWPNRFKLTSEPKS